METYEERQIESLKGVIAEQQERIAELEAEIEGLEDENEHFRQWFKINATFLATHKIGGYHFGEQGDEPV